MDNNPLFWIFLFLAISPVLLVKYPPMVDVAQHAAQLESLHQIWIGNPLFTDLFYVQWFTPYLTGYLLTYFLYLFMPIDLAVRVVIGLSMAAIAPLSGVLLEEAGSDKRWQWLIIPSMLAFAFYWGFHNYLVATPVGLFFLILFIRYDKKPNPVKGVLLAALSVFLFFSHVLVLGFTAMSAFMYLAGVHYKEPKVLLRRCLPLITPLPIIFGWLTLIRKGPSPVSIRHFVQGFGLEQTRSFGEAVIKYFSERLANLASAFSGLDLGVGIVLFALAIMAFPLIVGAKPSKRPELWLPLAAGLAVYLLIPDYMMGVWFTYGRLGVFLVPLWFLPWRLELGKTPRFQFLAILLLAVWIGVSGVRFLRFSDDVKSFDALVDVMKPGERTLSLMVDAWSPHFYLPVYRHFPSWYQAEKHGVVDFSFACYYPEMVLYRPEKTPRVGIGFDYQPLTFDWTEHGGDDYRYFVVRAYKDSGQDLFKGDFDKVKLIARSGDWWLYERK
ncbi:MAG: hypothetical protein ACLGPL_10910 [Acidobacteriota bacterium]